MRSSYSQWRQNLTDLGSANSSRPQLISWASQCYQLGLHYQFGHFKAANDPIYNLGNCSTEKQNELYTREVVYSTSLFSTSSIIQSLSSTSCLSFLSNVAIACCRARERVVVITTHQKWAIEVVCDANFKALREISLRAANNNNKLGTAGLSRLVIGSPGKSDTAESHTEDTVLASAPFIAARLDT